MQGVDRIKARDFHNLIGRAGRAGTHTEGTIIFSDPDLYDQRFNFSESWRWQEATNLLNPNSAEKTASSLLEMSAPFHNQREDRILTMDINEVLRKLLQNPDALKGQLAGAAATYANLLFTQDGLNRQFKQKRDLMDALESYLMANRGSEPFPIFANSVSQFAQETLAYALSDDLQKAQLIQVLQDLRRTYRIETAEYRDPGGIWEDTSGPRGRAACSRLGRVQSDCVDTARAQRRSASRYRLAADHRDFR